MSDERKRQEPGDPLAARARRVFDDSVESLDAATLSRLNRNRHAALEGGARGRRIGPLLLPAAGVAVAAAVAVFVISTNSVETLPVEPVRGDTMADFEILLQDDEFEMLEDLEFYSWVELGPEQAANVG